jgi:antitoxin (DNA-binding transcriptional repressor) of toxin-antitoxin stability system
METISATELARNTSKILDRIISRGEGVSVERNRAVIAQIVPPTRTMTAAQALSGLEAGLFREHAAAWLKDSREDYVVGKEFVEGFDQAVRDPWG